MSDTIKLGNLEVSSFKVGSSDCKIYLGSTLLYPSTPHDYSQDYFTIVSTTNMRIKNANAFSYSIDSGQTWSTRSANSNTPVITANTEVWIKATQSMAGKFTISGGTNVSVYGNVMSLLYGDDFTGQTSLSGKTYALNNIFNDCTSLKHAENLVLPATTLSKGCYQGMFYGCTSLTTVPVLPATTLAEDCYQMMFVGCTSLTTAPVLSATTLVKNCYNQMFQNCKSLISITCLATDISATSCLFNWVQGVSSTGTFTKAASMTSWTTGIDGIPTGWTVQDYSS